MRALKTIIVSAGTLKLKEPEGNESSLIWKAINCTSLPKFISDDLALFRGIIRDLFPDADLVDSDLGELESCIKKVLLNKKFKERREFTIKIKQI